MSKKIASGAGKILIDIKVGKGALIENEKQARELARIMIEIGKKYDREVICMLTRMDNPLGDNIGNKIEIMEVIDILKNNKQNNLTRLCIEMSSLMYSLSKNSSYEKGKEMVISSLKTGKAYKTFLNYIKAQGGTLPKNDNDPKYEIKSKRNGYIKSINSMIIGETSMHLGAGRVKKTDKIDYDAGIILSKNIGDKVKKGEVLATLYGKKLDTSTFYNAYKLQILKPKIKDIIIDIIK